MTSKKCGIDFSRGKIYKIIAEETDMIYIGSTTKERLCQRMTAHRADHKRYLKGKHSCVSSFEILKYPSCKIVLIENYPCENRDELRAREQFYISSTPKCVNRVKAYLSPEEKKAYEKTYQKEYKKSQKYKEYEKTPKRKEYMKEYRSTQITCECGSVIRTHNIGRHRQSQKHRNLIEEMK